MIKQLCKSFFIPKKKNKEKGISVHYLQTTFLQEVIDYNANVNVNVADIGSGTSTSTIQTKTAKKKIYDIENLEKLTGLIRAKGVNEICPKDGRIGASYVDCLTGRDNVGPANVMLSYSWGNTVEDIIDVLQRYCVRNSLDPKRTYVWMCCLCVNQHRVVEDKLNGKNVPFDEFRSVFKSRVTEINNVVALLSPWREPLYLKRVWCIFELFTADNCNSKLTIQMPKREEEDLKKSIYNSHSGVKINNEIYNSLAQTNIEDAEASVDNDRKNILELVNQGCGTIELDKRVNGLLRNWINTNLIEFVNELDHDFSNQEMSERSIDEMVDTYRYVGYIFSKNQQTDMALHCYTQQRKLCEANYSPIHEKTARSYNVLGLLHKDLKEYDEAINYHLKSISIKEEIYDPGHVETATSYFNIGRVYVEKKDYDFALNYYDKCRVINEGKHGYEHQSTASVYDAIGLIHYHKKDYQMAMSFFDKSLVIYKKVYGTSHPKTAMPLSNIGLVYYNENQDYEKALENFLEALNIRDKILGHDHPLTIESCKQIYDVYIAKGDSVQALDYSERARRRANNGGQ